jgi:hypothetical protein
MKNPTTKVRASKRGLPAAPMAMPAQSLERRRTASPQFSNMSVRAVLK